MDLLVEDENEKTGGWGPFDKVLKHLSFQLITIKTIRLWAEATLSTGLRTVEYL